MRTIHLTFFCMNAKTILNAAALLSGIVGIFFKAQHWPGANLLMLAGFGLLLVSALAFTVRDNTDAGTPASLNYVMVAALVFGIAGAMFKIMHWRGGFALSVGSGVLLLLLSLLLLTSKAAVVASRQFVTVLVISVTLLMAVLNMAPGRPVAPEVAASPTEEASVLPR